MEDSRMGCVTCAALPFIAYGTYISATTLRELSEKLKLDENRYKWVIKYAGFILATPTFLGLALIGMGILVSIVASLQ